MRKGKAGVNPHLNWWALIFPGLLAASRQKEYLTPPLRPLAVQGTGFVQQKGESTRYSIGGLTTPGMHKDSDPRVSQSRRNARGGVILNQIE